MSGPLLLRGGTVLDGTGADAVRADVLISDGWVRAIGAALPVSHATVVDVSDLFVTPGFVDLHSHHDFTLAAWPAADALLTQGVTTVLTGNCGFSPFPVGPAGPEELQAQAAFMADDLAWDWTGAASFRTALEAARPAVNVALQVGHHAVRTAVLGPVDRPPSPDELAQMVALVDAAAGEGVFGFSTGLIYAPGRFAEPDELIALASAAARHDLLYSTHIRDETSGVVGAVTEAVSVARESGVRVQVSHVKAMGAAAQGSMPTLLGLLAAARAEGLDVAADAYPFTASSTTLASRLPGWAVDGGAAGLLVRLGDVSASAAIERELAARMPAEVDPAGIVIAGLPPGALSWARGLTVAAVAERLDISPAAAVLALLAAHEATVAIINHSMTVADVSMALADPFVAVASDGSVVRPAATSGAELPHPRNFATSTTFLGAFVRDAGLLPWPEAVRKLTGLPAARVGVTDRGVLRAGAVADVAVWDPATVGPRSTYADPWQLSVGVEHVLVDGEFALRDGVVTGVRAGRVLRK